MSYILDALRRAQSERERGQVPGLHAQTGLHRDSPSSQATAPPLTVWLLVAGLALGAAAALSMWWLRLPMHQPSVQPVAVTAQPSRPASPNGPAAQAATPVGSSANTETLDPSVRLPAPAAGPPKPLPTPMATSMPTPTPMPMVVSAPAASLSGAPAPAAPTAPPAPVKADVAIALTSLPPELKRDWPVLTIGGSVWSDTPASRFVVLNGAVLRQGDEVVPGLVLEQILPKAATLRWRGMLVEMGL